MTEPITQFAGKHAFLSNFYPCPVEYGDETYPTVEHAYQAAKTTDRAKRSWSARPPPQA